MHQSSSIQLWYRQCLTLIASLLAFYLIFSLTYVETHNIILCCIISPNSTTLYSWSLNLESIKLQFILQFYFSQSCFAGPINTCNSCIISYLWCQIQFEFLWYVQDRWKSLKTPLQMMTEICGELSTCGHTVRILHSVGCTNIPSRAEAMLLHLRLHLSESLGCSAGSH